MAETQSSLFNKCVFIKDCKVKYRGIVPPCYALVEKITSTNKQSKPCSHIFKQCAAHSVICETCNKVFPLR